MNTEDGSYYGTDSQPCKKCSPINIDECTRTHARTHTNSEPVIIKTMLVGGGGGGGGGGGVYTVWPYLYAVVAAQEEVMIRWVYYTSIHQGPSRNVTTLPYLQEEKETWKATGSGAAKVLVVINGKSLRTIPAGC